MPPFAALAAHLHGGAATVIGELRSNSTMAKARECGPGTMGNH
jgi:hypothetical protein